MRLLRIVVALAVLAYAGWLAWPLIAPFLEGSDPGAAIEMSRAEASIEAGRDMPRTLLWGGAIVLYVASAFLLGGGNPRAFVAYLLGFAADAVLRLAMGGGDGGAADVAMRSAEAAPAGMDPTWFALGALIVGGLLVFWLSRRRRRARASPLALQDG